MILFLVSYLGGALTILSPCILPVLPFVFARADQPFVKSSLPLLGGMALTFAGVATLAALGGGWAVRANEYGRWIALAVLAVFGLMLLFPAIADRATRPLVALGSRLSQRASADGAGSPVGPSFLLGIATGLLWAPCAGPILGLLLTGAALQGASVQTSLLLLAYAAGAATSLAVALLAGKKVFAAMKRSLGAGEWVRRALGAAVLVGVVLIALGLDTGLLTRLSLASTSKVEQSLVDMFGMETNRPPAAAPVTAGALPVEGVMPELDGATTWLNSPPLTREQLRGKVVVVDFWTYSCINCLRSLPYVKAWSDKYKDQGLVVIGVHTPEFAFEAKVDNVRAAARRLGIDYPVAIDNDYKVWRAFRNRYWPAHFFVDAQGRIRHHHYGEGQYAESERVIQKLLAEAGAKAVPGDVVTVNAAGEMAAAGDRAVRRSPETYVGYARTENFVSGEISRDRSSLYRLPPLDRLNAWGLAGQWTVGRQMARLDRPGGKVAFRFQARDLHLVLGPAANGKPVRFRVTLDGKAPGADAGTDVAASGEGVVTEQRLYQLVRQKGDVAERTFEIEFLGPGAEAFAFTFG